MVAGSRNSDTAARALRSLSFSLSMRRLMCRVTASVRSKSVTLR